MNRHERRRARALKEGIACGKGGDPPPGYVATADMALEVARRFVESSPERPRFALIDRSIWFPTSMLDHGHRFCRNAAAEQLVAQWVETTRAMQLADGPTYMMLRAVVDALDLPYDVVPLDELFPGAEFRTINGAPAGKA